MDTPIPLGKYQHYKGNYYEVLGVARHSETREELVVYRALYGEFGLWVRPLQMFLETVEVEGKTTPRFKCVESSMTNDSQQLNIQFEQGVRLLTEHLPTSDGNSRKPILMHSIRVGIYLYNHRYSDDIILAGLMHDGIEWAGLTITQLQETFGDAVAQLVLACTKNNTIRDSDEKITELIQRCAQHSKDALIVKSADILDSFQWYTSQHNTAELDYCRKNAAAILKFKPAELNDIIFVELNQWLKN